MPASLSVSSVATKKLYHSPQTPGYTSWVGAARDGDAVEVAFSQVTGNPAKNPIVGDAVWAGTKKELVRLRVANSVAVVVDSEEYDGPPHAMNGQPFFIDRSGRRWRRVNGEDMQEVRPELPATAFLQYLDPDMTRWSDPIYPYDPRKGTVQFNRVRQLRNGTLVVSGNLWPVPEGTRTRTTPRLWLLMTSTDGGKTWKMALTNPHNPRFPANEWSWAELPTGDLLAVLRTTDPDTGEPTRRQSALYKNIDGTFTMGEFKATPFPHSGFPEVVSLRGGQIICHLATSGCHWTVDAGRTWKPMGTLKTLYYPIGVVMDNDLLCIYSHKGADNDYRVDHRTGATIDQYIQEQKVKLTITGADATVEPTPTPEPAPRPVEPTPTPTEPEPTPSEPTPVPTEPEPAPTEPVKPAPVVPATSNTGTVLHAVRTGRILLTILLDSGEVETYRASSADVIRGVTRGTRATLVNFNSAGVLTSVRKDGIATEVTFPARYTKESLGAPWEVTPEQQLQLTPMSLTRYGENVSVMNIAPNERALVTWRLDAGARILSTKIELQG